MTERRELFIIEKKKKDADCRHGKRQKDKTERTMEAGFPMDREEKKVYELEAIQKLIDEHQGLVRTAEITALGIDYRRILAFLEDGSLRRVKNGYYTIGTPGYSEEQLIEALYPDGVFTMETALYCYGYLSQRPAHWSIAISKNVSKSRFKIEYPIMVPYYSEPKVLTMGVGTTERFGKTMQIYTKDRLICEVLKYEDKMERADFRKGVLSYIEDEEKDVEALMDFARERKVLRKVQSMIGVWL